MLGSPTEGCDEHVLDQLIRVQIDKGLYLVGSQRPLPYLEPAGNPELLVRCSHPGSELSAPSWETGGRVEKFSVTLQPGVVSFSAMNSQVSACYIGSAVRFQVIGLSTYEQYKMLILGLNIARVESDFGSFR